MTPFKIIQGDSLVALRDLPSECFDGIITDPPYCSGGRTSAERSKTPAEKYVHGGTQIIRPDFSGDTRDQRGYLAWCSLWLAECLRVAKEGSPIVVFTDWRQLPITTDALQAGGWTWRGIAVWDKTPSARPQPVIVCLCRSGPRTVS
jgi:site-specific DNA-methyltransferase (adenine-specific)